VAYQRITGPKGKKKKPNKVIQKGGRVPTGDRVEAGILKRGGSNCAGISSKGGKNKATLGRKKSSPEGVGTEMP